jgi:hypothetical protein
VLVNPGTATIGNQKGGFFGMQYGIKF